MGGGGGTGGRAVHTLPPPNHAEFANITRRTAGRIENILRAHGRSLDPAMQDDDQPKPLLFLRGVSSSV